MLGSSDCIRIEIFFGQRKLRVNLEAFLLHVSRSKQPWREREKLCHTFHVTSTWLNSTSLFCAMVLFVRLSSFGMEENIKNEKLSIFLFNLNKLAIQRETRSIFFHSTSFWTPLSTLDSSKRYINHFLLFWRAFSSRCMRCEVVTKRRKREIG